MNISNTYVNLLRYVSANGKKCILETLKPIAKNRANIKYASDMEYKTVPLAMPMTAKGFSYEMWENIVKQQGETKSYALDGWFKVIAPPPIVKLNRVENEIKKCLTTENIDRIEFFKTLSSQEKEYLLKSSASSISGKHHLDSDEMQLFSVLSGYKPAWYCEHGFGRKIDFSKIKLNPKVADKFDVVKMPKGDLYFLNKQEVLKIIEENKDIYYAALRVKPTENLEKVYEVLLQTLQFGSAKHALFGITLGFPRQSSLIFELESLLKRHHSNLRENMPLFKEKMIELLHSEDSPYRNYPKETIEKLEKHIKAMQSSEGINSSILYCQVYGNEEKAVEKIIKKAKDFEENFKLEDLM